MQVFTVKEVAEYLHCSVSSVRVLVRKKEIPHFRIGSKLYFNKDAVDNWVKMQELKNLQPDNNKISIMPIHGGV